MTVTVKKFYWLIVFLSAVFIISGTALFIISYTIMSRTNDYPGTEAVISAIEYDAEDDDYSVIIDYSANNRAYHERLGYYSSGYKEGGTIEIRYDPEDPAKVYVKESFTLFMVLGVILLAAGGVTIWAVNKYVRRS